MRILLLAASAAGLSVAGSAAAQERGGLRGPIPGDGVDGYLLGQVDQQTSGGISSVDQSSTEAAYVPVSPGAVPDQSASASDDANGEAEPEAPAPPENQREDATAQADAVPEGTIRTETIDSENDLQLDDGAERVEAIEGLERTADDEPFAAPGIRMGTFILRPTLEQGVTATSNADSSTTGTAAVMSETVVRLNAASDWASHSATIDAYGIFRKTISGDEVEEAAGGVDAALELELGNDYRARAGIGYAAAPGSAASPVVIVDAESQPIQQTLSGTLGLEKDVGKARFRIGGGASHDSYGDAELEGGGTLSQRDRDSTLYSFALRAGYEVSPAITPFIETEIGRRDYDMEFDTAGYARSSTQVGARAGLALDFGEKLSGEFSAGWIQEDFDDDRLEPISSPSLAADLSWSPIRGTIVGLTGSTTLEGATTPGESGSVLYAAILSAEREMRSNLTGNVIFGTGWRNYTGSDEHDLILNAEAGLTWWLNRYAGLTTRVRHEMVSSNAPDRDSQTNSIFLGLKLQR